MREVSVDLGNDLWLGRRQRGFLSHHERWNLLELRHHVLHQLLLVLEGHVRLLHAHWWSELRLHKHVFFLNRLHVAFIPLLLLEVLKLHSILKALRVVTSKDHVLRHAKLLR